MTSTLRDEFSPKVRDAVAKRASYICSNPACRSITVAAASSNPERFLFIGKAAHIAAAAPKGPRYDSGLTESDRSDIVNAIFLCSGCADLIDRNSGADFSADLLRSWKSEHEAWVRSNLNKSISSFITVVDGEHHASGVGEVTGLDIEGAAIIRPGTVSTAEGLGKVTATRIGGGEREKQ
jgi:hypothetical protein